MENRPRAIIRPRPSLGQNFLVDGRAINRILSALRAHIPERSVVIEIGPGTGRLTDGLIRHIPFSRLCLIEKDKRCVKALQERYSGVKGIEIVEGDVLEFDFKCCAERVVLVGNIPYYITGEIVEKIIANRGHIISAGILVQKELAKRLVARVGNSDYSAFSAIVQIFLDIKMSTEVRRNSFFPAPKVDSQFIFLIPKRQMLNKDCQMYIEFVRRAFSNRRKKLVNNFDNDMRLYINKWLEKNGFKQNIRAEDISAADFVGLVEYIKGQGESG